MSSHQCLLTCNVLLLLPCSWLNRQFCPCWCWCCCCDASLPHSIAFPTPRDDDETSSHNNLGVARLWAMNISVLQSRPLDRPLSLIYTRLPPKQQAAGPAQNLPHPAPNCPRMPTAQQSRIYKSTWTIPRRERNIEIQKHADCHGTLLCRLLSKLAFTSPLLSNHVDAYGQGRSAPMVAFSPLCFPSSKQNYGKYPARMLLPENCDKSSVSDDPSLPAEQT